MKISVIVPTLNEAASLPKILSSLTAAGEEVIVVDGGSADATAEVARKFPVRFISSPRGRAIQMNRGAAIAGGDLFWFLHADTFIPSDWRQQILKGMSDSAVVGGGFYVKIDAPGLGYRFLDGWGLLRSRIQKNFYGDQGIFVRKEVFRSLGGFSPRPILEDLDFSARLSQRGKGILLPGPLMTSARRWKSQGWWRTVFEHSRWALSYELERGMESLREKRLFRAEPATLFIMAKAPVPGKVKTRLLPSLSPEEAALLAEKLLKETVNSVVRNLPGVHPVVAVAPPEGIPHVRSLLNVPISLIPQPEGDLGNRLSILFEQAFASGAAGVMALGTDHPNLPAAYLRQAAVLLRSGGDRVVLGPTEDGGYYLIGLNRPHPELFEGIPWSTPEVFKITLERARRIGLEPYLLPRWFDIDRPEDLLLLSQAGSYTVPSGRINPRNFRLSSS